tara:strand:+ start:709 stop:945 length:237 start_codon:yes stop_codon:yes gene_type:complete
VGLTNIHRVIIPPSPEGDGALIQAHYVFDKNIICITKLGVYTIVNGIIGCDIGENLDLISHLFMTKLIEAEVNEGIGS